MALAQSTTTIDEHGVELVDLVVKLLKEAPFAVATVQTKRPGIEPFTNHADPPYKAGQTVLVGVGEGHLNT